MQGDAAKSAHDGHSLASTLAQVEWLTGLVPARCGIADQQRGSNATRRCNIVKMSS
jgi:hypothetical protein